MNDRRRLGPTTFSAVVLRRLDWRLLRPIAQILGGDERSSLRGYGLELSDLRPYQPGDDVRHIHWSVTARSEQPFIREAQAERAADVWLVVDGSASMDWGTAACLKRDRALEFVALASQVLGQRGHRLGAVLYGGPAGLRLIPPGQGRRHLIRLLDQAARVTGTFEVTSEVTSKVTSKVPDLTLAEVLRQAPTYLRRRALLVVLSDFLEPGDWGPALGRLAQRHDVVAVRVTDPREGGLPDVGLLTVQDPETQALFTVDTRDSGLRHRFAEAARAQSEQIKAALARYAIPLWTLSTAEDVLPTLVRELGLRRARLARKA